MDELTSDHDRGKPGPPEFSPQAKMRRGSVEFRPSFNALKKAVRAACSKEVEWEARVVAGLGAVLAFTIGDVAAARALTLNARARAGDGSDPEREVVAYFEQLLTDVVPETLHPISSPKGIVETTATVIRGNLLAGTAEHLREAGSDLAYMALVPYLGIDGAKRWADTFSIPGSITVH